MSSGESPTDVVQRQLDAYNARDLDRFVACFADDARGYDLGAPHPTMDGKDAIRAVIDHEHVTGRNGSPDVFEIAVVYEVEEGLIRRFHAIRAE